MKSFICIVIFALIASATIIYANDLVIYDLCQLTFCNISDTIVRFIYA